MTKKHTTHVCTKRVDVDKTLLNNRVISRCLNRGMSVKFIKWDLSTVTKRHVLKHELNETNQTKRNHRNE